MFRGLSEGLCATFTFSGVRSFVVGSLRQVKVTNGYLNGEAISALWPQR